MFCLIFSLNFWKIPKKLVYRHGVMYNISKKRMLIQVTVRIFFLNFEYSCRHDTVQCSTMSKIWNLFYWKLTFSIFFVWKVLSESLFNWCWQNFKFLLKLTFYPDSRIQIWLFTGSSLLWLSESESINRIPTSPGLRIRIHQPDSHFFRSLNQDPSTGSSLLVSESGSFNRILTFVQKILWFTAKTQFLKI